MQSIPTTTRIEADGTWCPMTHCSRYDDSFHDLPPLRSVREAREITDPKISTFAYTLHGSFTGERMAVCAYGSPRHPALVAYDYQDGSIRWTSPTEDLPGLESRWRLRDTGGLLLARVGTDGGPDRRYVFAANPTEVVAYRSNGARAWKRFMSEVSPTALDGIGTPGSVNYSDDGELVLTTNDGWIVKLDPLTGDTIDAYRMETSVAVDGKLHRGVLVSRNASIVVGNVLYMAVAFKPRNPGSLHPLQCPAHVVRIDLSQPGVPGRERSIKPLAPVRSVRDAAPDRVPIGTIRRRGGSPCAHVTPSGRVVVLANSEILTDGWPRPAITAVEDDSGVLTKRWHCVLRGHTDDQIYSAPAFHAPSGTLMVTTRNTIYLIGNVHALSGRIPSPQPLSGVDLLPSEMRPRVSGVGFGSATGLTFDPETSEIVAYTNFRLFPAVGRGMYGFQGAFAIRPATLRRPRALWLRPLAVTPTGSPAPGRGTFGQPALFRYETGRGPATGLIVNTHSSGTFMFK